MSQRCAFVLSLTFVMGLSLTFVALGVVATLVGGIFGRTMRIWYYIIAAVCILTFARWTEVLEKAIAILILGVGFYFLWIA